MNLKSSLLIAVVVVLTSHWTASAPIGNDDFRSTIVFTSTTEHPLVASSTIRPRLRSDSWGPVPLSLTTPTPERASSTTESDNQDPGTRSPGRNSADYILSDAEYQTILYQLRLEAENDVAGNRNNYARDDESIDVIMRRFEEREQQQQQEQQITEETFEGTIREENREQLTGDQPIQRTSIDIDDNEEECPICLTAIKDFSNIPIIPCGHKFHRDCLDNWKYQLTGASSKCPICRTSLWHRPTFNEHP